MADRELRDRTIVRPGLLRQLEEARGRVVELESTVWDELRQTAEAAIERAESELRTKEAVIDASVAGLALWDLQGRISYVNPAFLTMWGYDAADRVVGNSIQDLLTDDPKAATIGSSLEQVGGWIGKLQALGKDGSPFTVMLSVSVIRKEDGTPDCAVGSFVEMTYRERLNTMLFRQSDWLEALHEIDRGILAGASLHTIGDDALRAVQQLIPCTRSSIALFVSEASSVEVLASASAEEGVAVPPQTEDAPAEVADTKRVLHGHEIRFFEDAEVSPLPPETLGLGKLEEPAGYALAPLISEGELLGSLNVALEPGYRLTSVHETILRQMAHAIAVAVRDAQLKMTVADLMGRLEVGPRSTEEGT